MNNNTVVKTIGTDFVTKLLSQLSNKENSVISPYGIAAVLAMAAEGANDDSLNEILTCLGFESLDELRSAVLDAIENPCAAFKSENSVEFEGGGGAALREHFKQMLISRYAADVSEKKSNGDAAVQLCNLATFRAEWFPEMEQETTGGRFRNVDGRVSYPAFLSCTEDLRNYRDDALWPTVQAVALPYKLNGSRIPYELVLVDAEKPLTQVLLQDILSSMRTDACEVEFPEFSVKSTYDLIPMMQLLGLQEIFREDGGALDSIATEPLYAAAFSQEAEIQVDKNGTVASALTGMTLCMKGGMGFCERFVFNKPFAYFLLNTNTGEILFAGKVNQLPDCEDLV